MLKAGVRINKLFSEKLRNKKFQMPAALTAVSEKREAREIPGFSFYDLNPAEAPPLGRKKKVCEAPVAACALSGAAAAWNVYCLRFHFPLAADKLPLLPCFSVM